MEYLNRRKEIKYVLGLAGLGALLYGIFKAYQQLTHKESPQSLQNQVTLTLPDDSDNEED